MDEILPDEFKKYKSIPYDLYCPSIQHCMNRRICGICGKYFATMVLLNQHVKHIHNSPQIVVPKIRPTRIAARRANEVMTIISNYENFEDVEWVDKDEVEPDSMLELICRGRNREKPRLLVISLQDHFEEVWTEKM